MSRSGLTRRALRSPKTCALFLALAGLGWTLLPRLAERPDAPTTDPRHAAAHTTRADARSFAQQQRRDTYGNLPLSFEAYEGRDDSEVRFLARGEGYRLFLTRTGAVIQPRGAEGGLRMSLVGADEGARAEAEGELPGKSNYFTGSDPSKWRTNVPHFSRVRYQDVYPGVDVVYYGNRRRLEYDFRLAPGANPDHIRLAFGGARKVRVEEESGDLLLETSGGELRQHRPVIYQEAEGGRREIAGRYVILETPSDERRATSDGRETLRPTPQTPDSRLLPHRLRGRRLRRFAPACH